MTNGDPGSKDTEWKFLERWFNVNRWQRELTMQELALLKAEGARILEEGLTELYNRQESLIAIGKTLLGRMEELARKDKELLAPLTRSLIRTELSSLLGEFGQEGSLKDSQHGHEYWIHAEAGHARGIKISVIETNRIVRVQAEVVPTQEHFASLEILDIREIPAKIARLKYGIKAYLSEPRNQE